MVITRRNFIKGAGLFGLAYVLLRTPATNRDSLPLEEKLNYLNSPGRHTVLSPVVGSRADEYYALKEKLQLNPALGDFEDALRNRDLYFDLHIVPTLKAEEADRIAEEIFLRYISRYSFAGVNVRNIVNWTPGGGWKKFSTNKTIIHDVENKENTWNVEARVQDYNGYFGVRFISKYIVAYHEVMHIEETEKKVPKQGCDKKPAELMPVLKTIMLCDEVYKRVQGIELSQEVDYNKVVRWRNNEIELGKLANFYRSLEQKYGSIGKAVVSEESLNLVNGKDKIQIKK